jgi:hypothetical protein
MKTNKLNSKMIAVFAPIMLLAPHSTPRGERQERVRHGPARRRRVSTQR